MTPANCQRGLFKLTPGFTNHCNRLRIDLGKAIVVGFGQAQPFAEPVELHVDGHAKFWASPGVVSQWYHSGMGMTLRTSEKQTEALRRQALAEGRSMQAVALSAIDEYIERRAHQTEVNAVLDKVIERERGVLRRLADT